MTDEKLQDYEDLKRALKYSYDDKEVMQNEIDVLKETSAILLRVAKAAAFIRENRFLGAWPDVVELEKALDEARKAGLL